MLEPAGSHGVWGLDDYHCLPFLLGSAQLITHNNGSEQIPQDLVLPNCVLDNRLCLQYGSKFHYLGAVGAVMEVKHGAPFSETSPMLSTIANLPSWRKVCLVLPSFISVYPLSTISYLLLLLSLISTLSP